MAITNRALLPEGRHYKFDEIIVLESAQGTRKSTAVQEMLPIEFFDASSCSFEDKDFLLAAQGKLLIETPEIAGFRSTAIHQFKKFISKEFDIFRPPYGRSVERRVRRFIVIGTANESDYIKDPTGSRRIIPVPVAVDGENIDVKRIVSDRPQLWSEAYARWKAKPFANYSTPQPHVFEELQRERAAREESNPFENLLLETLQKLWPLASKEGIAYIPTLDFHKMLTGNDASSRSLQSKLGHELRKYAKHIKKIRERDDGIRNIFIGLI